MPKNFIKRDLTHKKYIPNEYVNDEKQLTFIYKPLTNREITILEDSLSVFNPEDGSMKFGTAEMEYNTAVSYIVGWKNLLCEGEELPFNKALLESLNIVDELIELGKHIYVTSKNPELDKSVKVQDEVSVNKSKRKRGN